jgi:hypothetical protein
VAVALATVSLPLLQQVIDLNNALCAVVVGGAQLSLSALPWSSPLSQQGVQSAGENLFLLLFAAALVVAVAVLIVVAILFATRVSMPESFLWLQKKGRTQQLDKTVTSYFGSEVYADAVVKEVAESTAPPSHPASPGYLWFTMIIMIIVAAANTIGFGLMAYALAFAFFPHLQPAILAVFEGAGFVIGFLGLIADRVSRKKFLFWSFLGTFAMTVIVGLTTKLWQHDMSLFWILLVVLAGVNSLCYLTEDTVKAEV